MKRALALLASCALAACSFEPKYVQPEAPVPPSWPTGDAYLRHSEATLPSVSYRDIFRDPKLQTIIEQALVNNRDLMIAAANIATARAQVRIQRAELFPAINGGGTLSFSDRTSANSGSGNGSGGSGSGNGSGGSGNGSGGGGGVNTSYALDVGTTGWEIDLFGRIRSLTHAAQLQYFGQEAAARATRLALVSDIANEYFTYAADQSRLTIARETEANALRSVQLTGARVSGGIAARTDLAQARIILESARGDIASLTTAVAQDKNALDLLVGAPVNPALLPAAIEGVDSLVSELPAGLSSDVLLRRPDVVQAEYQLRAANAQIGAARAAFFPRISLTAITGLASTALSSLFSGGAFNWTVAPSATVPIFDWGANRGNLDLARAQRELQLARYEQAIQTAFRDVANALARRGTIGAQFTADTNQLAAAADSYQLTNARYRAGLENFLSSLVAQRALYTAQGNLVGTRLTRAQNLIELYRALGGDAQISGPLEDSSPFDQRSSTGR